jgi:hypothetical protein
MTFPSRAGDGTLRPRGDRMPKYDVHWDHAAVGDRGRQRRVAARRKQGVGCVMVAMPLILILTDVAQEFARRNPESRNLVGLVVWASMALGVLSLVVGTLQRWIHSRDA